MAKEAIFMECYRRGCKNVEPALAWVDVANAKEAEITAEDACTLLIEGFVSCRSPKVPGKTNDITSGICQLEFEPAEFARDRKPIPLPESYPAPPQIDPNFNIRYGSF